MRGLRTFIKSLLTWKNLMAFGFITVCLGLVHLVARLFWNFMPESANVFLPVFRSLTAYQCRYSDGYMPSELLGGYHNDPWLTAQCGWTDHFHWWDYHPDGWYAFAMTHLLGLIAVWVLIVVVLVIVSVTDEIIEWRRDRQAALRYRSNAPAGSPLAYAKLALPARKALASQHKPYGIKHRVFTWPWRRH